MKTVGKKQLQLNEIKEFWLNVYENDRIYEEKSKTMT